MKRLMKKLMMMAMMLVASATAFAGDSDALKAILKATTYTEAQSLINSSLAQLANDAEKAKAYNKLVDLAYEKYKKEDDTKTTNAVMQKNHPYPTGKRNGFSENKTSYKQADDITDGK